MLSLPLTFNDFTKNPISAMLFVALIAIGYLHMQNIKTLETTIEELRVEIDDLKEDNKELAELIFDLKKITN